MPLVFSNLAMENPPFIDDLPKKQPPFIQDFPGASYPLVNYVFPKKGCPLVICYRVKSISGWWFGTFFIFPYIGNVIIPTDELIFFRWVGQPATRYDFPNQDPFGTMGWHTLSNGGGQIDGGARVGAAARRCT